MKFEQSKHWDMNISAELLFNNFVEIIYIDTNYRGHKSDNGHSGICLYVKRKDSKFFSIITVDEEGLCYEGDTELKFDYRKVSAEFGYNILIEYRDLFKSVDILNSDLRKVSCSEIILKIQRGE